MELEEVTRHISHPTQCLLWGRAAGRCQFMACNRPLWKSAATQETVNVAEKAHIYAFSKGGSRGNDGIAKVELNELANLLLVCHDCHKTIDRKKDGGRYSVEVLHSWKSRNEARVERVTGIDPNRQSHVLLYGANIGDVDSPLKFDDAAHALFPDDRFPAEDRPIEIVMKGSAWRDRDDEFWKIEEQNLIRKFDRHVGERLEQGQIEHLSIFGLAPMPLLIKLGTLLTDLQTAQLYQLHRDPKGWAWPNDAQPPEFQISKPPEIKGEPALVISLSATIREDRITKVLGEDCSIWHVSIPKPSQECIRTAEALREFYKFMLPLMDEIKAAHGEDSIMHVFPAAPVSTMIELGRLRQAKADLGWRIWDENKAMGGFVRAIDIKTETET